MAKIRVLIAEDSATVRAYLHRTLESDAEVEVIGEADNGARAVELCQQLHPDVITMDMVLPRLSGPAATEYIMAHCPTPILVVSSSTSRAELFHTYDALAAGAVDVMDKPRGDATDTAWERDLIATVKVVSRIRVITRRAGLAHTAQPGIEPPGIEPPGTEPPGTEPPGTKPTGTAWPGIEWSGDAGPRHVVAIGASTGGPRAVVELLRALPARHRAVVLLVMHLGDPFSSALASWLSAETDRRVRSPVDGQPLVAAAGSVLLAPSDQHLEVRRGQTHLRREAPRDHCRPSVDVLFESLARECAGSTVACLLTGMGRDGANGMLALRRAGAITIAQDEASSVVYGMPRAAARLDAAALVLPLSDIGPTVASLVTAHSGPPR